MGKETTDELLARMNAKYGIAAPAQAPAQASTPVQQPKAEAPKRGIADGIIGILGGRKQQLDDQERKAVRGYANGGKIKGPGTPTSDSIGGVIKETGEPIKVSTKERIVSAAQEQALARIAEMLGHESVDAMFEDMTGKPVGPTIHGGMKAAATGMAPEDDPVKRGIAIMREQLAPQQPAPTARQVYAGVGPGGLSSNYIGSGPTDPDVNGRNAVAQQSGAVQRGIATMKSQLNTSPGGIGAENSVNSAAAESHLKSLYPAGTFDNPATKSIAGMTDGGMGIIPGLDINNPGQKQRNMAAADSAQKAAQNSAIAKPGYSNGIVTAESALAAMGGNMTRSGGIAGTMDMKGANEIMARENSVRQSMIDSQAGGSSVLEDPNAAANAKRSRDMAISRITDSMERANRIGGRAGRGAADAYAGIAKQMMSADADMAKQGITARGQDMEFAARMAQNETTRLAQAGSPADQLLKQAQAQGVTAQNESNAMLADLQKKALGGDQQALATLRALTSKGADYKDRYITLPNRKVYNDMGQIVGEEPGGIFDAATGRPVQQEVASKQQVPPADKREVGKAYQTPRGPMIWRGNGWEAAR